MNEILYDGRFLKVFFEGRMSVFNPRLVMNDLLQRRIMAALRRIAPEIDDYTVVVCEWRVLDHPTGQRGGYCEYSTRTIYLEDVGHAEDRIVWNQLIETAIHEFAHLVHGPARETHGASWQHVFAEFLVRAAYVGIYDTRIVHEHRVRGDTEYRLAVMELVKKIKDKL